MAVFYLKNRLSKRAAGLRRNKVENEALFHCFIGVSGSLRRRFRWPELFSWVGTKFWTIFQTEVFRVPLTNGVREYQCNLFNRIEMSVEDDQES